MFVYNFLCLMISSVLWYYDLLVQDFLLHNAIKLSRQCHILHYGNFNNWIFFMLIIDLLFSVYICSITWSPGYMVDMWVFCLATRYRFCPGVGGRDELDYEPSFVHWSWARQNAKFSCKRLSLDFSCLCFIWGLFFYVINAYTSILRVYILLLFHCVILVQ